MKAILFNGSSRKEGNTYHSLNIIMEELKKESIECEYVWIGGENLQGCKACGKCKENKDTKCVFSNDNMNDYIQKMISADCIVLGSPTYFADMTSNMKSLIERAGYVCRANGNLLRRKIGASIVSVRRGGGNHVFSSMNYFFLIAEMIVVGSSYWNLGIGGAIGDILNDEEGIRTFRTLGENLAWSLKKLK
ncbi:MAG: flavodoxin family protein [Candidatus Lokiarchaeota archaeon]|nr:flavodoxin family protein [Candidatus Lokiarchaeota archaeon]